jgi:hypothetical protein
LHNSLFHLQDTSGTYNDESPPSDKAADSESVESQNDQKCSQTTADDNVTTTRDNSQEPPKGSDSNVPECDRKNDSNKESEERHSSNDNRENTNNESSSENGTSINCACILTYLDEVCSRWRLNSFGQCLKESDTGCKLYDQLFSLAEKFKKDRLCRVLTDISEGRIVNRAESNIENADKRDV